MPRSAVLEVKDGGLVDSINSFLRSLLEQNLVEALIVPLELSSENMVAAALVSDPEMLKRISSPERMRWSRMESRRANIWLVVAVFPRCGKLLTSRPLKSWLNRRRISSTAPFMVSRDVWWGMM